MEKRRLFVAALLAGGLAGCGGCSSESPAAPAPSPVASAASPETRAPEGAAPALVHREGQALVRALDEAVLYVADEDHARLHRVELTEELRKPPPMLPPPGEDDPKRTADPPPAHFGDARSSFVDLPGRPAQVFALPGRVLVTVRDPGLLLVFEAGTPLRETARVSLPADAWGLAVAPDASAAYVTSAWTHRLTRVDLATAKVDWSVDVPREPRGVTVTADGRTVFVSHLVGKDLTRVTVGSEPKVERLELPPDPLRTIADDATVSASLGYALLLSPDGRRLFVARHALGGMWGWQGNPTVDVYSTTTRAPVAPSRGGRPFGQLTLETLQQSAFWADHAGPFVETSGEAWTQPRAMVYREKTRHLLVASEALANLVELDAMSVAPGVLGNRYYRLGGIPPKEPTKIQIPPHCGAPTGVALSDDEDVAWVYCRTTDNIVAVNLTSDGRRALRDEIEYVEHAAHQVKLSPWGPFAFAKLPVPAADDALALGRRLFFDGTEPVVSQGQGCAGCHPDGRDDGHVWRESQVPESWRKYAHFRAGPTLARSILEGDDVTPPFGMARQTPMLAGRVAIGPYGWHAESPTLVHRIRAGFQLHRVDDLSTDGKTLEDRAAPLARFLREGLVPPPREARPLTADEERGKAIFESPKAQCTTCHVPKTRFTDGNAVPLPGSRTPPLFTEDPNPSYRVPSLLFVGGTAPYYHDGAAPTLEALIETNQDRMGRTTHLSGDERRALVAYLKTL